MRRYYLPAERRYVDEMWRQELYRRIGQLNAFERTRFLSKSEDEERDTLIWELNQLEQDIGCGGTTGPVCSDLNDPDC